MAQQHYNLPTSQDDDDSSRQQHERPRQSPSLQPLSTWIIQPPTQRYPAPRIYEYGPHHGQEMESFHVSLQMDNTECLSLMKIAFGSCIMPTQSFLDPASNIIQLSCIIPSWSLTQSGDKTIPLYVIVTDHHQHHQPHSNVLDAWPVGYFTYRSRKRSSAEMSLDYAMMMKRNKPIASSSAAAGSMAEQDPQTVNYMLPTQQTYDYNYYGLPQQYMAPSTPSRSRPYFEDPTSPSQLMFPYRTTSSATDTFSYGGNDPMGLSAGNIGQMTASSVLPHGLTDPSATFGTTSSSLQQPPISVISGQPQPPPPSLASSGTVPPSSSTSVPPISSTISPSTSAASKPPGTGGTMTIAPHPPHLQSSSSSAGTGLDIAPATTSPSRPITTSPTTPGTTVNPFANLLSHADLVIEGDMDAMMRDWTEQEKHDHRRLVRFWRRQHDHEIICNCQAIPPTNRTNTSQEIIVSCIYWEEKQDYYITSVDIIYLLEALIGVRFTTEEKNRVRRNLEGFRPLTVSKLKPDSADFFRLIMAFNHPKPRNIEKDLKVFAWSSLPTALKKIISKYSASYSSTASVTLDVYSQ